MLRVGAEETDDVCPLIDDGSGNGERDNDGDCICIGDVSEDEPLMTAAAAILVAYICLGWEFEYFVLRLSSRSMIKMCW